MNAMKFSSDKLEYSQIQDKILNFQKDNPGYEISCLRVEDNGYGLIGCVGKLAHPNFPTFNGLTGPSLVDEYLTAIDQSLKNIQYEIDGGEIMLYLDDLFRTRSVVEVGVLDLISRFNEDNPDYAVYYKNPNNGFSVRFTMVKEKTKTKAGYTLYRGDYQADGLLVVSSILDILKIFCDQFQHTTVDVGCAFTSPKGELEVLDD